MFDIRFWSSPLGSVLLLGLVLTATILTIIAVKITEPKKKSSRSSK